MIHLPSTYYVLWPGVRQSIHVSLSVRHRSVFCWNSMTVNDLVTLNAPFQVVITHVDTELRCGMYIVHTKSQHVHDKSSHKGTWPACCSCKAFENDWNVLYLYYTLLFIAVLSCRESQLSRHWQLATGVLNSLAASELLVATTRVTTCYRWQPGKASTVTCDFVVICVTSLKFLYMSLVRMYFAKTTCSFTWRSALVPVAISHWWTKMSAVTCISCRFHWRMLHTYAACIVDFCFLCLNNSLTNVPFSRVVGTVTVTFHSCF